MTSNLKLTVLDQSPVHHAETSTETLNAGKMSIELAKVCDQLGYARYWLAEHHNSPQFAGPCPEILITAIASVTKNMRVGSGGVMLSHYSPYKVAEVFNMLNALFPGRIDLGIGRAPGGDMTASSALAWPGPAANPETYPLQASTLKDLLEQNISPEHPWAKLHISPSLASAPQMWMLGSSGGSATLAGQVGMHLALARFIAPDHCSPSIFDAYEKSWLASGHKNSPERMLAIACFCADTQEEAELLASTAIYRKLDRQAGGRDDLLSPEAVQNKRKQFSANQEDHYQHLMKGYTIGTPERCRTEIEELAKHFKTEEIAIVTVTHDFKERQKSYRLLMS